MLRRFASSAALLALLLLPACANDDDLVLADAAHDAASSAAVHRLLVSRAADLHAAALALRAAAPAPGPDGWSRASDPAAVQAMRAAWKQARVALDGLEGANDLFFPDAAAALDLRYEQALALGPDPDLFDGEGFVGLHAIERILWSDSIPPSVTAFEQTLPGYTAATFPTSPFAAAEFQTDLCDTLVSDSASLQTRVAALTLDSPSAYQTAVHLVKDQLTKLQEAGAGRDESRYAGFTLADMRANLGAAQATQGAFHAWLVSKQAGVTADGGAGPTGSMIDAAIASGFAQLHVAYRLTSSDRLSPPAGWSSVDPADTTLSSTFGQIFLAVRGAVDESSGDSLLSQMGQAIQVLGISPSAAADGGTSAATDAGGLPPDTDGT